VGGRTQRDGRRGNKGGFGGVFCGFYRVLTLKDIALKNLDHSILTINIFEKRSA
jgi:hypothetical protein